MASISIRPYDPEHDEAPAYALWQRTLHRTWPLSQAVFHRRIVPQWLPAFEAAARDRTHADIVVATDSCGEVVGSVLAFDHRGGDFIWRQSLGDDSGGVAVLGVAEEIRGKGVGLALAARATELLRARGLAVSYVGYTLLKDWYGLLGYRVWREYRMSWKALAGAPPNNRLERTGCAGRSA